MPMTFILIDPKSATTTFSNCYPLVKSPLECEFHLGKKKIKKLPNIISKSFKAMISTIGDRKVLVLFGS